MCMRQTRNIAVAMLLLLLSACGSATAETVEQGQAPTPPPTLADANRYLDDLYTCLNTKGYNFVKGADGGWSGQTGPANEPYEDVQKRYTAATDACNAQLGVNSQPRPAPSAS